MCEPHYFSSGNLHQTIIFLTMTSPSKSSVWLYDTTLRDGTQREGLSLSVHDKLQIAHALDRLGIPFIEGGWAGANPKDDEFFQKLQLCPLSRAEVVAFCSTRRPNTTAATDPRLQPTLDAETRWIAVFGKSWDLHVQEGLKTSLDENLNMIHDTISYFRHHQRRVIYDAEHWFDGYKDNPTYALETLEAAIAAGAEWLVLCDTNGGTLPHEARAIVRDVMDFMQTQSLKRDQSLLPLVLPRIGIHTHNDSGTAVANAIVAVQEGVSMVQGTINGYGERCGNADLCTLVPNLQLKMGYRCLPTDHLELLSSTSRLISEIANLAPDDHAPFVGRSAFAHKGGIHVSAVARNPRTYEHISPEQVGNDRRIVISDQAGLSNVLAKARSLGIELDRQDARCHQILQHLKRLENEGYQFDAAEASFELLIRDVLKQRESLFELKSSNVHCITNQGSNPYNTCFATVKVAVKHEEILVSSEGSGPVAALDAALRQALTAFYPEIETFFLTDYKVRILDGCTGISAKTRVLVESSNKHQHWTTVGVSSNILEASYQAVAEGLEYGLLLGRS
jgi:2-isopropylmalate synthase